MKNLKVFPPQLPDEPRRPAVRLPACWWQNTQILFISRTVNKLLSSFLSAGDPPLQETDKVQQRQDVVPGQDGESLMEAPVMFFSLSCVLFQIVISSREDVAVMKLPGMSCSFSCTHVIITWERTYLGGFRHAVCSRWITVNEPHDQIWERTRPSEKMQRDCGSEG